MVVTNGGNGIEEKEFQLNFHYFSMLGNMLELICYAGLKQQTWRVWRRSRITEHDERRIMDCLSHMIMSNRYQRSICHKDKNYNDCRCHILEFWSVCIPVRLVALRYIIQYFAPMHIIRFTRMIMVINSLTLSSAWTWLRKIKSAILKNIRMVVLFMHVVKDVSFRLNKVDPTILINHLLRSITY